MACSANQEQVFSPFDQSGVSNFALVKSTQLKMPSVLTNQHSVILPSILYKLDNDLKQRGELFSRLSMLLKKQRI